MRNDGVSEVLVKISGGDQAEGIEVVLDEQVNVIRGFRFKVRIAEADENRIGSRQN